jgi:glycosyltransferase involved in cell wall biosynthesis
MNPIKSKSHLKSGDPVRILHVIDSLDPAAGGPPEAVRQLVNAYIEIGDKIELACMDKPDANFLSGISCPVHALGPALLGRYRFSLRFARWLEVNAHRFDGIVMNGIWTFPGVAVRFAARRAHKPYGIFTHGALDPWFNRKYPLKHLKKLLYWPIQYAVLRDARAVFFTTGAERQLAATSFRPSKWNSVVVPYGINDPDPDPDPDCQGTMRVQHGQVRNGNAAVQGAVQIEAFYREFPALQDRRYLLFLARIHEKKGCDLLLLAFAKTAASDPEVDLVIAGPDQAGMLATLQSLAKKLGIAGRVHWPGLLGKDVKWGALRACEAFILPSHQENFGIAVIESLAVGRPVLISNQVNICTEIEGDGAGLVDQDTLEGTERLLRRWFNLSAAQRNAMAARARATFIERYTMNRAAAAIDYIFYSRQNEIRRRKLETRNADTINEPVNS